MGCTSSAPNMVTPKSNTAEKSIQFEGDVSDGDSNDVEEIIYRAEGNGKSEINVLPLCDNITDNLHLARNKSTPEILSEKDHENINIYNDNKILDTTNDNEEKIQKLEEVVEKVVELYIENVDDSHIIPKNSDDPINETKNDLSEHDVINDHSEKDDTSNNGKEADDLMSREQRDEHLEEATSPSQSESSRATRWEALADIAAELPPSLAVDPITGQIYAISK